MTEEHYAFSQGKLTIVDSEINLDFQEPFTPMTLPDDVTHSRDLGEGLTLHVENGRAWMEKNGKVVGQSRHFHPEGSAAVESYYSDEGQLHGPSRTFFPSGSVASQSWYCQGTREGKSFNYNEEGHVTARLCFRNGKKTGLQIYYFDNGQVRSSIPFEEGQLHGTVDLYHESGIPRREARYDRGKREGTDTLWSAAGKMVFQRVFEGGRPLKESFWSPDGLLIEERVHHNLPDRGPEIICWDGDGHLRIEGKYEDKRYHYQEWDQSGVPTKEYYGCWDGKQVIIDQLVHGELTQDERARFSGNP